MNFNEINNYIGKSKFFKILGWVFLLSSILVFFTTIVSYFGWESEKSGYIKQYVYSENGYLYYELDNSKIYVDNIYNTDKEKIELEIPDKRTVLMYCDKKNNNQCIYFDMNNSVDESMINPIPQIILVLILVAISMFLILNRKKNNKTPQINQTSGTSFNSVYLLFITLFCAGITLLLLQGLNIINYSKLKNDNNIVTATIYSEFYKEGTKNDKYKPVSYYYVNGKKYIYVNDLYEDGTLEENLDKTFDLYYDVNNPNKVSKTKKTVNYLLILVGICFTLFSFPFIFFKKKMEIRLDNILSKRESSSWKI